MRILLSNDDGIESPGLQSLKVELSVEHEVWVSAPADAVHFALLGAVPMKPPYPLDDAARFIRRNVEIFTRIYEDSASTCTAPNGDQAV